MKKKSIITGDILKAVGAAVGPGKFFLLVVKEDAADVCDIGFSCRSPADVKEGRAWMMRMGLAPKNPHNS